MECENLFGESK